MKEGWKRLLGEKKRHFFNIDYHSLCKRWMTFNHVDSDDNNDHKDNCVECTRRLLISITEPTQSMQGEQRSIDPQRP